MEKYILRWTILFIVLTIIIIMLNRRWLEDWIDGSFLFLPFMTTPEKNILPVEVVTRFDSTGLLMTNDVPIDSEILLGKSNVRRIRRI